VGALITHRDNGSWVELVQSITDLTTSSAKVFSFPWSDPPKPPPNVRGVVGRDFQREALRALVGQNEEGFRAERLREIETIIRRIQKQYLAVHVAYQSIRQELLR
jgi:hypothetical protein